MKWAGIYRPRISSEHLQRLWRLKERTKKPITKLVDEALDYYFDNAIDEDGKPICELPNAKAIGLPAPTV
jgi:hypothetical protein